MLHNYDGDLRKINKPFNKVDNFKIPTTCNSLGYRSEEYNPHAKIKIFVCGSSTTFGTGLHFEDVWPQQFKKYLSNHLKYESKEINLLNFSASAESNDYITRTIISQCNEVKPDLLIICFTHSNRTEYVSDKKILSILPGRTNYKHNKDRFIEEAIDYYNYFTEEMGFINTLKNMLLL